VSSEGRSEWPSNGLLVRAGVRDENVVPDLLSGGARRDWRGCRLRSGIVSLLAKQRGVGPSVGRDTPVVQLLQPSPVPHGRRDRPAALHAVLDQAVSNQLVHAPGQVIDSLLVNQAARDGFEVDLPAGRQLDSTDRVALHPIHQVEHLRGDWH